MFFENPVSDLLNLIHKLDPGFDVQGTLHELKQLCKWVAKYPDQTFGLEKFLVGTIGKVLLDIEQIMRVMSDKIRKFLVLLI